VGFVADDDHHTSIIRRSLSAPISIHGAVVIPCNALVRRQVCLAYGFVLIGVPLIEYKSIGVRYHRDEVVQNTKKKVNLDCTTPCAKNRSRLMSEALF
jgi:hypothetical protein